MEMVCPAGTTRALTCPDAGEETAEPGYSIRRPDKSGKVARRDRLPEGADTGHRRPTADRLSRGLRARCRSVLTRPHMPNRVRCLLAYFCANQYFHSRSPVQGDGFRRRPLTASLTWAGHASSGHVTSQDVPEGCRCAADRTASWRCCVSAPAMNRRGALRLDTGAGRERPPPRGTS